MIQEKMATKLADYRDGVYKKDIGRAEEETKAQTERHSILSIQGSISLYCSRTLPLPFLNA